MAAIVQHSSHVEGYLVENVRKVTNISEMVFKDKKYFAKSNR
jgi:hypothetical protein